MIPAKVAQPGRVAFRAELLKIMPGYDWTIHKGRTDEHIEATGTQSSGFNRLSTLSVTRIERDGQKFYRVMSSGYGLRAQWLATRKAGTLARALRSLQDHYEATASTYQIHASDLKKGRLQKGGEA